MNLGQWLLALREERGLSRSDVATLCALSPTTIHAIEMRKTISPGIHTLWNIAVGLDVSVYRLCDICKPAATMVAEYTMTRDRHIRSRLVNKLRRTRYGQMRVTSDQPGYYAAAQQLVTEGVVERVSWEERLVRKGPKPPPGQQRRKRWHLVIKAKPEGEPATPRRVLPPGAYEDGEI